MKQPIKPAAPKKPKKPQAPRKPQQTRSIQTKEKILDAALALFCEKGYYKTTTNEIAQRAGVSIGSLYSYFKDKDTVFLEILEKYHQKFNDAKSGLLSNTSLMRADIKQWLRALIDILVKVHEESRELNRELTVLSFYNPHVAEILDQNIQRTMKSSIGYFLSLQENLKIKDIEAAAVASFDLISATVDRIVFGKCEIDRSRLIDAVVDMLYKYYME